MGTERSAVSRYDPPMSMVLAIDLETSTTSRAFAPRRRWGRLSIILPPAETAAGVLSGGCRISNLRSAQVLRSNYLRFGSWPLALAAYNPGGDTVRRFGGIPPYAETRWYVTAVLRVYSQIHRLI